MKMKESVLKVTIFYGRITQVTKRGSVYMYYKEHLPITKRDDLYILNKYIKQICEKLSDPLTAPKTYWKILNRLLNNKNVPAIPHLLVNREITSNFFQKAAIFNK